MQRLFLLSIFLILILSSCKKESADKNLIGEWNWTIQYKGDPAFSTTPLNTGIQEKLFFTTNGGYSLTQNGLVTNSGTYRTSTAKNPRTKMFQLFSIPIQGSPTLSLIIYCQTTTTHFFFPMT